MAIAETLKLLFNITSFYPHLAETFLKSITPLLSILQRTNIPTPALSPPVNYIINALINLDLDQKRYLAVFGASHPMFPSSDKKCIAERLINILDQALQDYAGEEPDVAVVPTLTLIRKMHEMAPESVQKFMQTSLLPSDADRNQPLGRSDTLPSKLLRMSTSASLTELRTSISAMMFELSGKDAQNFVRNVGYGFAAGFLMSNGMTIPANASEAFSNGGSSSGRGSLSSESGGMPINPITGQRLDAEPQVEGPPMTEAEKEREAERLFVLFERFVRCKSSGVVLGLIAVLD